MFVSTCQHGFGSFFSKYTATHYQVTRSAPSREPNDTKKRPYVNTRQNKLSMSRHSQLRKEKNPNAISPNATFRSEPITMSLRFNVA